MQHLMFFLKKKKKTPEKLPFKLHLFPQKNCQYISSCRIQARRFFANIANSSLSRKLRHHLLMKHFLCSQCNQVRDSLRQLMDHLNDDQKTCAMQILRLHFGSIKSERTEHCIKAQKKPQFHLIRSC